MSLKHLSNTDSVNGVTKNNPPATLTKAELSDRLNQALGYNRNMCEGIVEAFFETTCQTLEKGEQVKFSGFGNFNIIDKEARPGRNPKTGEEKIITARRVVTFKSGGKLKARVVQLDPKAIGIDQHEPME